MRLLSPAGGTTSTVGLSDGWPSLGVSGLYKNIVCGLLMDIHCHSACFKSEPAQALEEENAINNGLETSEIEKKSFAVHKGGTGLKSNILPSPQSGRCGRVGIFFLREHKGLISSPEDRNNQA